MKLTRRLPWTILSTAKFLLLLCCGYPSVVQGDGLCVMQYLLADNNLERFIREDLVDWTVSPAIQEPTLTTWAYFDSRNLRSDAELAAATVEDAVEITQPLINVFTADGSQLLTEADPVKYEGSYYLTFRHDLEKMVVNQTLPSELNGEDPAVLQNFVQTALDDCINNHQRTEFVIFFSSHGGGFYGFGDDRNKEPQSRQRHLMQTNGDIVQSLQGALAAVPGAPDKFDVIGFDACLMQAADALDDFHVITKYFLASQTVVPGHGWAYEHLSETGSALDFATQILNNFIDETQGTVHRIPKTLAIVDASRFDSFIKAWDALCAEFLSLLRVKNDGDFLAMLNRARSSAVDFESALGDKGDLHPAAMDLGNFMARVQTLCNPFPESTVKAKLDEALAAYNAMFIARRVGKGTPETTGMHITWPYRGNYKENQRNIDYYLFDNPKYVTTDAPNFSELLKEYYTATTTTASPNGTVCQVGAKSTINTTDGQVLLLNPVLNVVSDTEVTVESDLAISVDNAMVYYGVDIKDFVDLIVRGSIGRQLSTSTTRVQKKQHQGDSKSRKAPARRRLPKIAHRKGSHRHMQQTNGSDAIVDDSIVILYGGEEQGTYSGSHYKASWDRRFFAMSLNNGTRYETLFVFDEGEGSKSIPVYYFPLNNQVDDQGFIQRGTTWEEADQLGGKYGYLRFSVDPETKEPLDNLILYTEENNTGLGTLHETPRSALGSIAPMVIVQGYINGEEVDTLVGGINGTLFPWNEDTNLTVVPFTDKFYMNYFSSDTVTIDMIAFDYDVDEEKGGYHWVPFEVLAADGAQGPTRTDDSSRAHPMLQQAWLFCVVVGAFTTISRAIW